MLLWAQMVQGKVLLLLFWPAGNLLKLQRDQLLIWVRDLLDMAAEDRAKEGIFLGFQYPIEIPGVSMVNFMKTAVNEHRKYRGEEPLTASDFLKLMRERKELVEIDSALTKQVCK